MILSRPATLLYHASLHTKHFLFSLYCSGFATSEDKRKVAIASIPGADTETESDLGPLLWQWSINLTQSVDKDEARCSCLQELIWEPCPLSKDCSPSHSMPVPLLMAITFPFNVTSWQRLPAFLVHIEGTEHASPLLCGLRGLLARHRRGQGPRDKTSRARYAYPEGVIAYHRRSLHRDGCLGS